MMWKINDIKMTFNYSSHSNNDTKIIIFGKEKLDQLLFTVIGNQILNSNFGNNNWYLMVCSLSAFSFALKKVRSQVTS